ncbi:glucose dehydrogenase [Caerostris extrusa]|uniref:Glucose dehydrogenase n=1 Tax=Caerostris extrusa TaxID=172846 RepID=A0AAV4QVS2_CAEEX|nr:glucose dehydrogenase [Caerostris extrusa]
MYSSLATSEMITINLYDGIVVKCFVFGGKGPLRRLVYKQVFESCSDSPVYICCVSPLQPKSRGTVRLRSSNPYDPPVIDPNYFEDQRDLQVQVEGLKNCNRFVRSEPMKKVGAKPLNIKFPGDEQCGSDEDCYLENMVKSFYIAYPQGVGTCKMGDPRDDTTVVDPSLRKESGKPTDEINFQMMQNLLEFKRLGDMQESIKYSCATPLSMLMRIFASSHGVKGIKRAESCGRICYANHAIGQPHTPLPSW